MRVKRGGGEIPAKKMAVESDGTDGSPEVRFGQEPDGVDDYFEMKFKQRGEAANLQD